MPFVSYIISAAGGIFCPRGGSRDAKQATVQIIADYQQELENNCSAPLVIFPEGATSSNRAILPFKRGAFSTRCKIKPYVLKYACSTVHISNEIIDDSALILLFACNFFPTNCEIIELPAF
jgi:1-acyl-sn-glycerol-3-phosphate acyltransferase